jgi:hypothetical protein
LKNKKCACHIKPARENSVGTQTKLTDIQISSHAEKMATGSLQHDLTTEEGIQGYLSSTPFAASKVTLLAGGTANFTYRAVLHEPYIHNQCPIHTMIVKHAEPYIATSRDFPLEVERQVSLHRVS